MSFLSSVIRVRREAMDVETVDFARVNAFSGDFFGGNPAAVCYLPSNEKDDDWLQRIAHEFNLSETAFLVRRASNENAPVAEFDLRWFTPKVEVDLCGHATLAAAHVLFSSSVVQEKVVFHTRSGTLTAHRLSGYPAAAVPPEETPGKPNMWSTCKGVIELDFPLSFARSGLNSDESAQLCKALGVNADATCFSGKSDLGDYLVELSSSRAVEQIQPDYAAMVDFPGRGGVIVTARTGDSEDYICRFFCPKAGILEDPVTGSAHCTLGSYWSKKLGRNKLEGYQASERGGRLTVTVDWEGGRARLQGCAITVMAGVLLSSNTN